MSDKNQITQIWAASIFGARTKQPLVQISGTNADGSTVLDLTITVEEARDHAMAILEAAEGAEMDAVVWAYFTKLGMHEKKVAAVLLDFRKTRDELREKRKTELGESV